MTLWQLGILPEGAYCCCAVRVPVLLCSVLLCSILQEWDLMSTRHHIQELWDARHKQQQQQREAAAEAQEGPALSPSNITHAAALVGSFGDNS